MARKYLSPLNLLNLTSDPGTATEGDFYWNSSTNRLRIYFDGAWADVSSNTAFKNDANTFTTAQTITPATSVTGLAINGAASSIGLVVKANATTPGNIQEWQNSLGTALSVVDFAGRVGLRTSGSVLSSTLAVSPSSSSAVAVTIRGLASQSANLLELQDSAGTNVVFVKANGSVNSRYFDSIAATGTYLDTNLVTNSLVILGRSTSAVTTIIRAVASQTADLIQAQNSAGSVVFKVSPTGVINAGGTTTIGNVLTFSDPGIAVETRFNFLRATDSAWLAINEMTSDSTYYEFGMADNPSGGDYFQWRFDNWEGPSYGWMPIQMSGYLNRFTAASNTMYGNFALPYNTPYANINNAAFNAATINVNKYSPTQSTTQSLFKDSGTGTGTVTLNAQSFTGSSRTQYWIEIESGATTFKWGNGASGATPVATGVAITGSAQTLNNGVSVTISVSGHVAADKWSFVSNPRNTVGIGGTSLTTAMETIYPSSAIIGTIIRGASGQSASLQEWQNSSSTVLSKVDASGNITAASFVKTSGTSAQFLKADGTVDSSTYLTTGTASSTYQPLDADLTAIAALASGTGLLKNTSGTWSLDTSTYLTTGTASSTYLPLTGGTISSNLIITGDLTVNGTTTNLNSTNLVIEDKNIVLGDTATPSNTTADGGGITLKGATDKTFNWINSTGYWTSNVGIEASSFVKTSGTSSQFLKADGSVDASTYLTTGTASSTYAPLASPSLTGTPLSTTAASSVSSTQIATTAYVKSLFSSASVSGTLDWNDVSNTRPGVGPTLLLGSATNGPGGANYYHPLTIQYAGTDGTSNVTQLAIAYGTPANEMWMRGRYSGTWSSWVKFALTSSPTFTGTPLSTTAAVDTNTTQIATTAFVVGQASAADPLALGSVAQGTSLKYSRQDHVHPSTGLALLAGATFTGQIQSTLTGSAANGQLYLNGATSNRIDFNINGVAAPAFTTRSAGTKIVLYPNISGSTVDYAIGIDNSTLWQSVLNSTASFKWYAGTTQVASLSGAGLFSAVSKSFDIQHPTKPDMRLRYGSLEGPENGVYVRGNTKENIIELPEVWTGLVDESTITVSLTSVGKFQKVYLEKIENNKIYIGGRVKEISYVIFGERKDIDKITVEY